MAHYILDGKTPVKIDDIIEWATWFQNANRIVKKTDLPGGVKVSTVFLGIDQSCSQLTITSEGHMFILDTLGHLNPIRPILFETMIIRGGYEQYTERYSTWEEAEAGHQRAIDMVFEATP